VEVRLSPSDVYQLPDLAWRANERALRTNFLGESFLRNCNFNANFAVTADTGFDISSYLHNALSLQRRYVSGTGTVFREYHTVTSTSTNEQALRNNAPGESCLKANTGILLDGNAGFDMGFYLHDSLSFETSSGIYNRNGSFSRIAGFDLGFHLHDVLSLCVDSRCTCEVKRRVDDTGFDLGFHLHDAFSLRVDLWCTVGVLPPMGMPTPGVSRQAYQASLYLLGEVSMNSAMVIPALILVFTFIMALLLVAVIQYEASVSQHTPGATLGVTPGLSLLCSLEGVRRKEGSG